MVISQNIPSLRTQLNMSRASRMLSDAARRMSSGYRINSAKEDPTGMSISNKLSLQLAGIEKATDNAGNGVALIQTAEGALSEVHNMLQRMRELAVQAANDTNSVEDREKIYSEVRELVDEIQSTAGKTEYNKIKILNGEGSRISESLIPVGTDADGNPVHEKDVSISTILYVSEDVQPGQLEYEIEKVGTPAIHELGAAPTAAELEALADKLPEGEAVLVNGIALQFNKNTDYQELQTQLAEALGAAGIEMKETAAGRYLMTTNAGSNQEISISGDADMLAYLGLTATGDTPVTGTDAELDLGKLKMTDANGSLLSDSTDGLTYFSKGNQITVKGMNGEEVIINVAVSSGVDSSGNPIFYLPGHQSGDTPAAEYMGSGQFLYNGGSADGKTMIADFKEYGPIKIQVGGSYNNSVSVYIPKLSAETLGLIEYKGGQRYDLLNYNTTHSAQLAIDQCEDALQRVSNVRARLGAFQNRLESTVRALEVAGENTQSSRSRIRDTDMAKEMTEYSSNNVMYQAGISILTQANQRPMQVLSLLN